METDKNWAVVSHKAHIAGYIKPDSGYREAFLNLETQNCWYVLRVKNIAR